MSEDKKELARKMTQERAKSSGRKSLNTNAIKPKDGLSFFGDDADGWQMSPKTILLFSVAYMGCVILLHIFGKVTTIKAKNAAAGAATPEPDTGAGDL